MDIPAAAVAAAVAGGGSCQSGARRAPILPPLPRVVTVSRLALVVSGAPSPPSRRSPPLPHPFWGNPRCGRVAAAQADTPPACSVAVGARSLPGGAAGDGHGGVRVVCVVAAAAAVPFRLTGGWLSVSYHDGRLAPPPAVLEVSPSLCRCLCQRAAPGARGGGWRRAAPTLYVRRRIRGCYARSAGGRVASGPSSGLPPPPRLSLLLVPPLPA